MSLSRRFLLSSLIGGSGVALAQSLTPAQANIGFKADTLPERSESGVGALMPWADSLWAVTYNSHMQGTGYGLGLYRIDETLVDESRRVALVIELLVGAKFIHGGDGFLVIHRVLARVGGRGLARLRDRLLVGGGILLAKLLHLR